ncbi:MAG: hypothetical protein MMC33_010225 [Icmadophila ericetorum]|nr:hypothetical protein [Icmadophila ericetorum]
MKSTIFGTGIHALILATVLSRAILAAPIADAEPANLEKRTCVSPYVLGGALSWAMLAATAITEPPGIVVAIDGNIGVTPAGGITGITAGEVTGTINTNNPSAASAMATATSVCACASAAGPTTTESYFDITGKTFTSGIYAFSQPAVNLDAHGTVTFSGHGQFIMHIGTTLTTGANAVVALINGATACNIFWIIGSSATIGANNIFDGIMCAYQSITFGANATEIGLMIAENGAITLDGGTFTKCP